MPTELLITRPSFHIHRRAPREFVITHGTEKTYEIEHDEEMKQSKLDIADCSDVFKRPSLHP